MTMLKTKRASKKIRTYKKHDGLVQLAAKLSDRSPSTVYGVLQKRFKSSHVETAIRRARAILRTSGEAA